VGRAVQVAGARREGFGFGRGWIRARRELLRVSGDMHGWRARERPASVADLSAPRAAAGAGRPSAWGLDRPVGLRPVCVADRPAVAHAAVPLAPFRAPALPMPPCSTSRWSFSPSASLCQPAAGRSAPLGLSSNTVRAGVARLAMRSITIRALFRYPQNSKFFHSLSITSIFSRLYRALNINKK